MQTKIKDIVQRLLRKKSVTQEEYEQLEDENTPPPKLKITFAESRHIILAGLTIIILFFGIGGAWVTFAKIGGAIIAPGQIKIDSERKTVQHLEGGIVREILVRNGDHVSVGQPLIKLDSSRIVATTGQVKLQIAALRLDDLRLSAEKNLSATVDWPTQDESIPAEEFAELLESANKVFNSGLRALNDQIALLNKQLDQLHQQDVSIDGRIESNRQIEAALQEELDAKLELYKNKFIDKTPILKLRRSVAEYRGQQAQLRGSQAELREKMAEFELKIEGMRNEYRNRAITQQADVQKRLFDLQQQLLPLIDAKQRLSVKAPVSGVVVGLNVHSKGGVISPGQPLLDIVPRNSHLIVKCHVQIKDITHIFIGQDADVQLSAYPVRTTPKILGKVIYISADSIVQKTAYGEQPSYVVHIELDRDQLLDNDLEITAGMPAVVFIRTKLRTVLDYALEPLSQNFDRALREN